MDALTDQSAAALTKIKTQLVKPPKDLLPDDILDAWGHVAHAISAEPVYRYEDLWFAIKSCGLPGIACESMWQAMDVDKEVSVYRPSEFVVVLKSCAGIGSGHDRNGSPLHLEGCIVRSTSCT